MQVTALYVQGENHTSIESTEKFNITQCNSIIIKYLVRIYDHLQIKANKKGTIRNNFR